MENNNNNRENKPSGSKFNSFWIYGIIALLLLAVNYFSITEGQQDPISKNRLEEMIVSQDVDKLVVLNQQLARIYIKKDKLSEGRYEDAKQAVEVDEALKSLMDVCSQEYREYSPTSTRAITNYVLKQIEKSKSCK